MMQSLLRSLLLFSILFFALCAVASSFEGLEDQQIDHSNTHDRRFGGLTVPYDMYWPSGGDARCVNLTDVPALYPGVVIPQVCYDYILWPNSVYVDNNTLIRNVIGRVSMGGTWTSPDCLLSGYRQWCTLMFRPCQEIPVPSGFGNASTIAVGQYPCRYYCEFSHNACYGAIVDAIKATNGWTQKDIDDALSCEPAWAALYGTTAPGTDIFPNGTYTDPISANGGLSYFNYTLPCYDGNVNVTTPPPATLCPDGMYFFDGFCYFDCPEPLITDSEYDTITTMLSVMGWISLVSAAFLALTFLMDPDKRRFPADLSIFFILCILCLSFSFCIGSMAGWRNVWCDDNNRPNTFGGPACTIQGIIFVYFTLASVLWWLVLSINLLLMVTKLQPHTLKLNWAEYFKGLRAPRGWVRWESLYIGYHIFAWFPPFIPLIIALGAERLGYGGHDLWCTIHSGDQVTFTVDGTGKVTYEGGDPANIWNLILLTLPILSIVALGICILVFVVVWGIWKTGWRFFYQQWRLFLFIMFFIWIYVFVFSFQISLAVAADEQYQAYTDYINCKNLQAIFDATSSPILPDPQCQNSVDSKVSFPLWFIVAFNEASQGLLLFLLYGTSYRFFKTWYYLFRNPKALISSKYRHSSSTDNTYTHKKTFTVEGRKVTSAADSSTHSKHMVDEIDDDDESSDATTSTEETDAATSSSEESEEMKEMRKRDSASSD